MRLIAKSEPGCHDMHMAYCVECENDGPIVVIGEMGWDDEGARVCKECLTKALSLFYMSADEQMLAALKDINKLIQDMPGGYLLGADPGDTSPEDMSAHIAGLIVQRINEVL